MNSRTHFIWLMLLAISLAEFVNAQQSDPANSCPKNDMISMDNPKRVAEKIQIDSTSLTLFGETLGKHLKNTWKLRAYKLSNFLSQEPDSIAHLEKFTILDTRTIDVEKQQIIANMLLSDQPYMEDKHMKNLCLFLPDMGFVFETSNQPVHALVSLDCKMVRFYFQETEQDNRFIELNTKFSYSAFDELYKELFSKGRKKNQNALSVKNKSNVNKLAQNENQLVYVVKRGQGLSQVVKEASKQFDQTITIKELCQLNGISRKAILRTGQELIVGYLN